MTVKAYNSTDKKQIPATKVALRTKNGVFDKLKNKKGQIPMEISNEAYIALVSKNLYGDTTAFIREYVANEARQVKESIKLGNKDARIVITIDGYTRKIVIEGINSMGISNEEFDKIYRCYGLTGNNDGTASGQFGIGKASYVLVADTILIESWSKKTDDKFYLLGKGGILFEEMSTDGITLKHHGTRFTTVAKKGIDLEHICKYCEKLGKFLGVPIYMNIVADSESLTTSFLENYDLVPGMQMISKPDVKNYFLDFVDIPYDDVNNYSHVYLDTEDYTLEGIVSSDIDGGFDLDYPHDIRLVGIPIDSFHFDLSLNGIFTLNVKDERKFKPVSSRDVFTKDTQNILRERIQKDLQNYYKDKIKDINNLDEYLQSENRSFFNDIMHNNFLDGEITTTNLTRILTTEFIGYYLKNDRIMDFKKKSLNTIQSHLHSKSNIMYTKTKKLDLINKTLDIDNNAVILILKKSQKKNEFVEMLDDCGVKSLTKFLKAKKIKSKRVKKMEIDVYNSYGTKIRVDLSQLPKNIIVIPNDIRITTIIKDIDQRHRQALGNILFVKENMAKKILTNKTVNLIDLEALVKKVCSIKFTTSQGVLTGKQIYDMQIDTIRPIITNNNPKSTVITIDRVEKITNIDNSLIVQDKKKRIFGINIAPLYLLPLVNNYNNVFTGGWKHMYVEDISSTDIQNIRAIAELEKIGVPLPTNHPVYEWHQTWKILSGIKNKYLRDVVMLEWYEYNSGWDSLYKGMYEEHGAFNSLNVFKTIDSQTEGMDRDQTRSAILNMTWNNKTRNGVPSALKYLIVEDIIGGLTDNIKNSLPKLSKYIQVGLDFMYKNKILNTHVTCELQTYKDRYTNCGIDIKLIFDSVNEFVFDNKFILAQVLPYYKKKDRFLKIKTIKHVKPNGIEMVIW